MFPWRLLPSTTVRIDRKSFWSISPLNKERGAPFRVNNIMLNCRFDSTLQALQFTHKVPLAHKGRFWEVREMIERWKENMCVNFAPSWVSCLDKSILIGSTSGHIQDGCLFQENRTCLETSTILFVVTNQG